MSESYDVGTNYLTHNTSQSKDNKVDDENIYT